MIREAVMNDTGRTENFFTRNSKVIAFLLTVGVFLAVFGPILFFEARDYYTDPKEDDRPIMTQDDLIKLRNQGYILVSQLTHYACDDNESEWIPGTRSIRVELDGGRYILMASAPLNGSRVTECYIYDLQSETNDGFDIFKTDLRTFFNK